MEYYLFIVLASRVVPYNGSGVGRIFIYQPSYIYIKNAKNSIGNHVLYYIYTPCLKNVPRLTCYNLDTHCSITIIFGTHVTEKVDNQNVLYFPTLPNLCLCTAWGNSKP